MTIKYIAKEVYLCKKKILRVENQISLLLKLVSLA